MHQPTTSQQQSNDEEEEVHRSALWVKDNKGNWHNADLSAGADEAIVLAGEDLEASGVAAAWGAFAAEHAVRVDPVGEGSSGPTFGGIRVVAMARGIGGARR